MPVLVEVTDESEIPINEGALLAEAFGVSSGAQVSIVTGGATP
jgi:hypothetical protein